jgi:serine/threonine protein kinase
MEKKKNNNNLILVPKQLLGVDGYDQLELLARSDISTVFKARQISQQQPVAIKVYSIDATLSVKKLLKHDLLFNARGGHPNIVRVFDRGFTPTGMPFFVMEYFAGINLDKLIESCKLDFKQKIEIAIQCSKALTYAHEHGMPHGEVKPVNIRVNKENRAKIQNFGIFPLLKEAATTEKGDPQIDNLNSAQEDIHSLGVLIYKLFSGAKPEESAEQVNIPTKISDLYYKCINEELSLRPKSATVITECLMQVEADSQLQPSLTTDSSEEEDELATPSAKDHSNAATKDENFWIKNPKEIQSILRQLAQNVTTITASSNNTETILTTLLEINLKRNLLILDIGNDERVNAKLLDASNVTFRAEPKNVEIRFKCGKLANAQFRKQPVFVCQIPNSLFYLERREAFRVPTSKVIPPHCILSLDNNQSVEFPVVDISAGGLGMNNHQIELNAQLQEAEKHSNCSLYLPEIGETLVNLHLRNFRSITLKNNQEVTRIGAMFFDLSPQTENTIQRYVNKLQIQQIATSKST